jgi:hypothetical protein
MALWRRGSLAAAASSMALASRCSSRDPAVVSMPWVADELSGLLTVFVSFGRLAPGAEAAGLQAQASVPYGGGPSASAA